MTAGGHRGIATATMQWTSCREGTRTTGNGDIQMASKAEAGAGWGMCAL